MPKVSSDSARQRQEAGPVVDLRNELAGYTVMFHVARRRHRRDALHEGASGRPLPMPALGLRHQGQDDRSVRRP